MDQENRYQPSPGETAGQNLFGEQALKATHKESSELDEERNHPVINIGNELERLGEKGEVSIRKIFELINTKLVDISPSFIVDENDSYLKRFEQTIGKSAELGEATGVLFNALASRGLRKPDKEYTHVPERTWGAGRLGRFVVRDAKRRLGSFSRKSLRIASAPELTVEHFLSETPPQRTEKQKRRCLEQSFTQRVMQDAGVNAVEQIVYNDLYENWNYCSGNIYVYNQETRQILDMRQLVPEGSYFMPSKMREFKEVYITDGEGYSKKKVTYIPKDLNGYQGMQTSPGRFYADSDGVIAYGDLTKKGSMLSLLHEVAHSWQKQYQKNFGRGNFEDLYHQVSAKLKLMDMWLEDLKQETDEERKKTLTRIISKDVADLKEMGVEVDPEHLFFDEGQQLGNGVYKITSPSFKMFVGTAEFVEHEFNFLVKTDKFKPLIEDFVSEEREAWAQAIRALRFLRSKGFDLEPELKSLKDFQDYAHSKLGTYQAEMESRIQPTDDIRKFTTKGPK